ncbi:MAG: uroporphyrinogen decarboxylase family protein, partial [bacterium]
MMSQLDDKMKAMHFEHPEFIPLRASIMPAAWIKYRERLEEIVQNHPIIFGESSGTERDFDYPGPETYSAGEHIDNWGCVWSNITEGMEAIVTRHPIPEREDIRTFKAPAVLKGSFPHGFMYLRLADLRGFEELMIDFAEEPEELQQLIDLVLGYNMQELELILSKHRAPYFAFGDDLGMQASLPVSPQTWRKYLKPCYMKMYQRVHQAGIDVYMHTDGHIYEIIPDLIDCGVNVVNPQIRANGLDNLVRVCKGKVCVDLDLDRQMFPFCKPEEIDNHVHEAVEALGSPEGGLWLTAEIGPDVP